MAEEEAMNQMPNPPSEGYGAAGAHPTSAEATAGRRPIPINREQAFNVEALADGGTSNVRGRSLNILWRVIDFIVAAVFIYAGVLKMLDPAQFAHDINNYRILPWTLSVALAFYLPWLEIFCGLALIARFLYRGALSILAVLIVVFTLATIAAKVRGLDITCGCFGHASQHWSLPAHLATNLTILAALVLLWVSGRSTKASSGSPFACGS